MRAKLKTRPINFEEQQKRSPGSLNVSLWRVRLLQSQPMVVLLCLCRSYWLHEIFHLMQKNILARA